MAIVLYGVGLHYRRRIKEIKEKYSIDYVSDKKLCDEERFDGYPVLPLDGLNSLKKDDLIIVCVAKSTLYELIQSDLAIRTNATIKWVELLLDSMEAIIKTNELVLGVKKEEHKYSGNNKVEFKGTIPMNTTISFKGINNKVVFYEDIQVEDALEIICGSEAHIEIGANNKVGSVCISATYGKVNIGNDCLFSGGIVIRNNNGHHIFDKKTGERISCPADIVIGDNVWICEGAMLFKGFNIGSGSIVGARSLSSSSFGQNVLIAGLPARVIREDICWKMDSEYWNNYNNISECL